VTEPDVFPIARRVILEIKSEFSASPAVRLLFNGILVSRTMLQTRL
jgi:hypothetical protein